MNGRLIVASISLVFAHAAAAPHATPAPHAAAEVNLRRTVVVDVVERAKGAVVNISTTKLVNRRMHVGGDDPFWQQFDFGPARKIPASSLGSGFIVHPEGYVITNHHVIDRARQITVELADGRKLSADLISSDAEADLAVLKISDEKPLPALPLGDSSDLLIGEPVIAVGNPLGFSHSVSTGIVSAAHRDLKDEREQVILGDLIQTDAAINPGNSGGPLLNAYGQVIGINTAVRGDAQNIGFAIQVNKLRDLIPELLSPAQVKQVDVRMKLSEKRTVTPPATVNVEVQYATDEMRSPRTVVRINGQAPRDIVDAYAILLRTRAGEKVEIDLPGGGHASAVAQAVPAPDAIVQARARMGMSVEPLSPALAQKYGLATEDGMFVTEVARGSTAARAGLEPGDVIISLGRYQVRNLKDFGTLMQMLPEEGRVRVGVIRGNQLGYGIIQL
jgi:S1-C subfamily serine protease